MAAPLDDIRHRAGVGSALEADASCRPGDEPAGFVTPSAAPRWGSARRSELEGLLDASRGAPADLTSLRPAAIVVALAAAVTVVAHPALTAWVERRVVDQAGSDSLIDFSWVFDWASATLTIAQAHRWAPVLAAVAVVAFIVVAAVTAGFRQARAGEALALVAAGALAVVAMVPLLLATALAVIGGLLYVVVHLVVFGLMLAAVAFVLAGLFTR